MADKLRKRGKAATVEDEDESPAIILDDQGELTSRVSPLFSPSLRRRSDCPPFLSLAFCVLRARADCEGDQAGSQEGEQPRSNRALSVYGSCYAWVSRTKESLTSFPFSRADLLPSSHLLYLSLSLHLTSLSRHVEPTSFPPSTSPSLPSSPSSSLSDLSSQDSPPRLPSKLPSLGSSQPSFSLSDQWRSSMCLVDGISQT